MMVEEEDGLWRTECSQVVARVIDDTRGSCRVVVANDDGE